MLGRPSSGQLSHPDVTQAEVQQAVQDLVDNVTADQLDALWTVYEFRAQPSSFIAAVHLRHHPSGHTPRLGPR